MKNKLTLGLLIFVAGALITACGSKKSTSTTNNNTKDNPTTVITPITGDATCQAAGVCHSQKTFTITNVDLYQQTFNYATHGAGVIEPLYHNGQWNGDGFANSLVDAGLNCAAQVGIAKLLAAIGINHTSAECTLAYGDSSTTTTSGGGFGGTSFNTTPRADIQANFNNSKLTSVVVMIRTGSNGGNGDVVEFIPENSNSDTHLYNRERTIRLMPSQSGYIMDVQSGQLGVLQ